MEEEYKNISNKKFIIKFIIFTIISIVITGVGIYFTLRYLNVNNDKESNSNMIFYTSSEEIKKEADDKEYGIQSYSETCNTNSMNIINYYDTNGKIMTEEEMQNADFADISGETIQFVQIDGLIDQKTQKSINEKLKQAAYNLKTNIGESVYTWVTANFSNILSVQISNNDVFAGLTIDLSTGEEIPFEDIFVSSAPINLYLIEALHKTLAWTSITGDNYEEIWNMDNMDTSDYEDKEYLLLKNYKKQKGNISYSVYPSYATVYNLVGKDIVDGDYNNYTIDVDFINHKEDIAIYKKYLTYKSIFEQDSIGTKGLIVLTRDPNSSHYYKTVSYGKITDNVFVEEVYGSGYDMLEGTDLDIAVEFIKKMSDKKKEELKNKNLRDKGMIVQTSYEISMNEENNGFKIYEYSVQVQCEASYFKNEAFKDYINMKAAPTVEDTFLSFSGYSSEKYPNLEINDLDRIKYYIDKTRKTYKK